MKINNRKHTALTLVITCLLGATIVGSTEAKTPKLQTDRDTTATTFSSNAGDPGRLVIWRIPNLGNAVIVDLYIDGVATSPIVYGQTFEAALSPGRHVLSVVASPHAKWPVRSETALDVQNGQTYSFTALGNGSGELVLKGA